MLILFCIFSFVPGDVFIVTGKWINHTIITYHKIQPVICLDFFMECLCLKNWCTSYRILLTTHHIQLSYKMLWRNGHVWAREMMGIWHTVEDNQHHTTKLKQMSCCNMSPSVLYSNYLVCRKNPYVLDNFLFLWHGLFLLWSLAFIFHLYNATALLFCPLLGSLTSVWNLTALMSLNLF